MREVKLWQSGEEDVACCRRCQVTALGPACPADVARAAREDSAWPTTRLSVSPRDAMSMAEGGAKIDAARWATEPDTQEGGPSVVEYPCKMLLEAEARSIGAVMGEGSTGESALREKASGVTLALPGTCTTLYE